ncbi:Cyclic di-GMP phosphodiesterase Gmr [compost metagenome]
MLPGCDIVGAAACVAELQQAYAGCRVAGDSNALQGLQFSAGIACYPQHGSDEEALLREADAALYLAKAAGRNCVRYRD